MPRGSKFLKKEKLSWSSQKGSHGRRPTQGKRPRFTSWADVRKKVAKHGTVIIHERPEEAEAKQDS